MGVNGSDFKGSPLLVGTLDFYMFSALAMKQLMLYHFRVCPHSNDEQVGVTGQYRQALETAGPREQ